MDHSVINEEDERLWDELHHHQSREAIRHSESTYPYYQLRVKAQQSVSQFMEQTSHELRRIGCILHDAAWDSYREQKQQQNLRDGLLRRPTPSRNAWWGGNRDSTQRQQQNAYFEEFGLPDPTNQDLQNGYQLADEDVPLNGNHPNEYIHLNVRFRPENEGWASVSNLDLYFQSLYSYYYNRGLVPICTRGIVELITLYFTLFLSIVLFVFIDWHALSQCTDEHTCSSDFVKSYIRMQPFTKWSLWNAWVILYGIIFCLYSIMSTLSFIHTIQNAIDAKWVYEERLGISARKLMGGAVDWDRDMVQKLIQLQESGEYRIIIPQSSTATNADTHRPSNQHQLDALMIANRILRKENFMIALFNRNVLDLSVPLNLFSSSGRTAQAPTFFCSSLEWSVYFCVLNFMFNHKYQIRPAFYLDPAALRRRFQVCGIAHIIFMPFLLFFVTLYFGLQNAYDWKSTKQYLGPREWSMSAKWTFREFNELPHFFERRLAPSYDAAEAYVDLFGSNEYIAALGHLFVFIGGSLGAVLLAFAAMNDAIVLHVKIADWNLLWYGGLFGVLYSAGKAMIPKATAQPKSARNLYAEMDAALAAVASHTHYYPETWVGRGWDHPTYAAFSSMFQYKVRIFLTEVLALIVAPYILCVSLANGAESICEFVLTCRAELPGAGDVCGFATFDFDTFQDESTLRTRVTSLGSNEPMAASLSESILQTGNIEESTRHFPKPKARHGKMEKSFATFKEAHPSWNPGIAMNGLSSDHRNVSDDAALSAIHREQDLHRIAAARQLETLERIEEGKQSTDEDEDSSDIPIMDEAYIPILGTSSS